MSKKPTPAKNLYSKKPMTLKELTKKSGFPSEGVLDQYRKEPDLRPEHAKRKPGARL